jgi:hypothetical protein
MKISEFIFETEDHIKLYWILKGFNIDSYYTSFNQYVNMQNIVISKSLVLELYSHVDTLLHDKGWQYLENDVDFDETYDKLLDLHDSIKKYLSNR